MIQEVEGSKVSIRRKISPNLEKAIKQIRIEKSPYKAFIRKNTLKMQNNDSLRFHTLLSITEIVMFLKITGDRTFNLF